MRLFGLIGNPLGHSFSKGFFNNKFKEEDIEAEYKNFELPTIEDFKKLINKPETISGLNVTIPYKEQIIPYLHDCSKEAKAIGAVNVIEFRKSKEGVILIGHNSDVYGFTKSIEPLIKPWHQSALVLGTGGASKAVVAGLDSLSIESTYVSRTPKKGVLSYSDINAEIIKEHSIIVNTSPLGMHPNIESSPNLPYHLLTEKHLLYDLVYNPELTQFMKLGKEQGATVKNGLEMLHLQAIKAWDIWNQKS